MSLFPHLSLNPRLWFTALLLILLTLPGLAQKPDAQRQKRRQQMAETQARHIARQVPLNDKKTARFIPVYCRKQQEIWALAPQRRRQGRTENDEAQADIEARFSRSEKVLAIRKKYYKEYRRFLTPKEIERVYELEKQLMQHMRQRQGGRGHAQ